MAERVIRFRVRTILTIFALAIAVWMLLHIVSLARHVLVWVAISLFLALAMNPLVEWLQRRVRASQSHDQPAGSNTTR